MKKKIFALVLCVALLAVAIVGGTLAYFTDTKAQTNTFTAGNVAIKLDEAVVESDANGNLVAKGNDRTTEAQTYKLYPGMTVAKDPTITVTGTEDAYIGAIITVTGDVSELIGTQWGNIDITKDNLVSGGIANASTQVSNWNGLAMVYENTDCVVYQDYSDAENNVWKIYVFVKNAKSTNDTVVLFDKLTISAAYTNEQMAMLNGMTVSVAAYAAQEHGFGSCFEAMTTAFATDFPFATTP